MKIRRGIHPDYCQPETVETIETIIASAENDGASDRLIASHLKR